MILRDINKMHYSVSFRETIPEDKIELIYTTQNFEWAMPASNYYPFEISLQQYLDIRYNVSTILVQSTLSIRDDPYSVSDTINTNLARPILKYPLYWWSEFNDEDFGSAYTKMLETSCNSSSWQGTLLYTNIEEYYPPAVYWDIGSYEEGFNVSRQEEIALDNFIILNENANTIYPNIYFEFDDDSLRGLNAVSGKTKPDRVSGEDLEKVGTLTLFDWGSTSIWGTKASEAGINNWSIDLTISVNSRFS